MELLEIQEAGKSAICRGLKNIINSFDTNENKIDSLNFIESYPKLNKSEIVDADEIAKKLANKENEYYKKIIDLFGMDILDEKKELNRKKLAEIVFNDQNAKKKLDLLTFEYVVLEIKKQVELLEKNHNIEYIIIDVPLLFESNLDKMCKYTIGILASEAIKIRRICKRDNISAEMAKKRLENQPNDKFYIEKCDFVLYNETCRSVKENAKKIYNYLIGAMY